MRPTSIAFSVFVLVGLMPAAADTITTKDGATITGTVRQFTTNKAPGPRKPNPPKPEGSKPSTAARGFFHLEAKDGETEPVPASVVSQIDFGPEPLDTSVLDTLVNAADAATLRLLGTAEADPGYKRLLKDWYTSLAEAGGEIASLEDKAVRTGAEFVAASPAIRQVIGKILADEKLSDNFRKISRMWLKSRGRTADGVVLPAVLGPSRKVGPWWVTGVRVSDDPSVPEVMVLSRARPDAVEGDQVVVLGLVSAPGVVVASACERFAPIAKGDPLDLNTPAEIPEELAKELAKCQHGLYLNHLKTLSTPVAAALAKHENWLYLNGLTDISPEATEALARHKGELRLNGLVELSDEEAELFAAHKGGLSMDGLRRLSDKAAASLAQHEGWLYLSGLTRLSDNAAEAFSKHRSELVLDGLRTLSDSAAEVLARHAGRLYLDGLTDLSDKAAAALRANPEVVLPPKFTLPLLEP